MSVVVLLGLLSGASVGRPWDAWPGFRCGHSPVPDRRRGTVRGLRRHLRHHVHFGGLRIDPSSAQVLDTDMQAIPGLFAAGELVGGLFYFNYPGGTGLTNGSVFGRIAGRSAAS